MTPDAAVENSGAQRRMIAATAVCVRPLHAFGISVAVARGVPFACSAAEAIGLRGPFAVRHLISDGTGYDWFTAARLLMITTAFRTKHAPTRSTTAWCMFPSRCGTLVRC